MYSGEGVPFLRIVTDMTAKSSRVLITYKMHDVITGEETEDYFEVIRFDYVMMYLKELMEYKINKYAWDILSALYDEADDSEVSLPVEMTVQIMYYIKHLDYPEDASLHSISSKELLQYITDMME